MTAASDAGEARGREPGRYAVVVIQVKKPGQDGEGFSEVFSSIRDHLPEGCEAWAAIDNEAERILAEVWGVWLRRKDER